MDAIEVWRSLNKVCNRYIVKTLTKAASHFAVDFDTQILKEAKHSTPAAADDCFWALREKRHRWLRGTSTYKMTRWGGDGLSKWQSTRMGFEFCVDGHMHHDRIVRNITT